MFVATSWRYIILIETMEKSAPVMFYAEQLMALVTTSVVTVTRFIRTVIADHVCLGLTVAVIKNHFMLYRTEHELSLKLRKINLKFIHNFYLFHTMSIYMKTKSCLKVFCGPNAQVCLENIGWKTSRLSTIPAGNLSYGKCFKL